MSRGQPGLSALRDASPELLTAFRGEMDPVVYRRCSFVLAENARVIEARYHLAAGDFASLGGCLLASHYGLRDDYEVSCNELDLLVELAEERDECLGARMMGGGFGGCTLHLLERDGVTPFRAWMESAYERRTGRRLTTIPVRLEDGIGVVA
jgi:galactokinase